MDQRPLSFRRYERLLLLLFAVIFFSSIISPPSLMDDVDAAQAQMARNMLTSGDWVSARLDGVLYIDKAPLKYWATALCYSVFGVHDWVARLPNALAGIALCWVLVRFGRWAISERAGLYAGLFLSTCVGLFLFTRIVIPDVILTLWITLAMWSLLRVVDEKEAHPARWSALYAATVALALLTKGLIGVVFPVGIAFVFLLFTRRLFERETWRRLHPWQGVLVFLVIAAPWHILAILNNPPYLDFTMHAEPGKFRGFFWFYFINDQLLRFLNRRYPRDYNTVPRFAFWALHLVWLFPWSVYLTQLRRLSYKPTNRRGNTHLLALCWTGLILLFFTFSTTQEYYSMPVYPALALLMASALVTTGATRPGARVAGVIAALAAAATITLLILVRGVPTPGDISIALTQNPSAYTLSLGHMQDLTIPAFAYLRLPLILASVAFLIGAVGAWWPRRFVPLLALAAMMVLFFQAARLALVTFDPYLTSRPIADVLVRLPKGRMIEYGEYYNFSSMLFYANVNPLMWNGRYFNLEYGSYAPDAPHVFIDNDQFQKLWSQPERSYLAITADDLPKISGVVGKEQLFQMASIGGKYLFSNQPR